MKRGRFWRIPDLAAVLEVSPDAVRAAARITGRAILPTGIIRLPATQCAQRTDFIAESIRADLANQRQQARIQHADA